MTKFSRECFHTKVLDDEELAAILGELCVEPDKAQKGDILAIEFPYSTRDGIMDMAGMPSRALVSQGNGTALRVAWFALIQEGMEMERIQLLARAAGCMSRYWCPSLSDQLEKMDNSNGNYALRYDLLICEGAGALVRNAEDNDDGLFPNAEYSDKTIQSAINSHSAIALPPFGSSHARLGGVRSAIKGSEIANIAFPINHPRDFEPIHPEAQLP